MGFFSDLFGGPTTQQKDLANSAATMAQTFSSNYAQRFGQQSTEFNALQGQLNPIAALGPSQMGWSPQLASAVSTQNINAAGAASRNAQQATASVLAGRGGGSAGSGITSGIEGQIAGAEASAAENQLSASQLQATEANAEQGNKNFWNATAGESALARSEDPSQYGDMAMKGGELALQDANQIQKEKQNAAFAPISLGMKALGGAASFITGGISNVLAGGANAGSGHSGGIGNFFSGGFDSLAGNDN